MNNNNFVNELTNKKNLFDIINYIKKAIKPKKNETIDQWASQNLILDRANAESGLYSSTRTPYVKKIMELLSPNNPAEKVILMKGAQIGGTMISIATIAYYMLNDPCSIMFLFPSRAEAEKFSKGRLEPIIEANDFLKKIKTKKKGVSDTSTILRKEFFGGFCLLVSAGSAKELRSTPIRILIATEADAFSEDVQNEGHPLKLAEQRTVTFNNVKKYYESTPTIFNFSIIEKEFLKGNQCYYNVPCPFCEFKQKLIFSNLIFETYKNEDNEEKIKKGSVFYKCINCQKLIKEDYKTQMLEKGEWIETKPIDENSNEEKIWSFHLSSLYSPIGWTSWDMIVNEFLEAKTDPIKMKTFKNTKLGETYKEDYEKPFYKDLMKKSRNDLDKNILDDDVVALFAGVDVQKNRFAYTIIGIKKNGNIQIVDHDEVFCEVGKQDFNTKLKNVLFRRFYFKSDNEKSLKITASAIDSGYMSDYIYFFTNTYKTSTHNLFAIKGSNNDVGAWVTKGVSIDKDRNGQKYANSVNIYSINTQLAKKTIYAMLSNNEEDGKAIVFNNDLTEDYYKQLTSEVLVNKIYNGIQKQVLVKLKSDDRNEALDCLAYAYAIAKMHKIDDLLIEKIYKATFNKINKDYLKSKNKNNQENIEDVIIKKEKNELLLKDELNKNYNSTNSNIINNKNNNINNGNNKNIIFQKVSLFNKK